MRIFKMMLAIGLIGSMLGACTAQKEEVFDGLSVAFSEYPSSFAPTRLEGRYAEFVQAQMFETLITLRGDEYVPLLAETLPVCEDNGVTCIITLKKGITFHDGTTFDSASVVYSLQHLIEAQSTTWIDSIKEVKALDATKVEIKMNYPDGTLFSKLANPMFAMIQVDSDKDEKLDEFPIGTGPYKFVSKVNNQTIILTRYDNYHGEKAIVGDVEFVLVDKIDEALTKLRDDEVQIVMDVPSNAKEELSELKEIQWIKGETEATAYLGIRTQSMANGKLEKIAFRKGLLERIDLDALTLKHGSQKMDNLLGIGVFGNSPIEISFGSNDTATWKSESITMIASKLPTDFDLGNEIKEMLAAEGFSNVTLKELNQEEYSTTVNQEKSFDLALFVWEYALADGGDFLDAMFGVDASNPLRFQDTEIEALLNTVNRSVDPDVRKDAMVRIEEILIEDGVLLPLTKVVRYHGVSSRLDIPGLLPDGSMNLSTIKFIEK